MRVGALPLFLHPYPSQVPKYWCLPSCLHQVTSAPSELVLASNSLCIGAGAKGPGGGGWWGEQGLWACALGLGKRGTRGMSRGCWHVCVLCTSEPALCCVVCFMCIEMCIEKLCAALSLLFAWAGLIVVCVLSACSCDVCLCDVCLCDACEHGMHEKGMPN